MRAASGLEPHVTAHHWTDDSQSVEIVPPVKRTQQAYTLMIEEPCSSESTRRYIQKTVILEEVEVCPFSALGWCCDSWDPVHADWPHRNFPPHRVHQSQIDPAQTVTTYFFMVGCSWLLSFHLRTERQVICWLQTKMFVCICHGPLCMLHVSPVHSTVTDPVHGYTSLCSSVVVSLLSD
jgi:hypothetical protein